MDRDLTARGTPRRRFTREVRRGLLIDVAEELFVSAGFSGVTMEDICRAAGVSRPVLYSHFPSRDAVYLACVSRARRRYDEALFSGLDPSLPLREQLRIGAEIFFELLETDAGRWRLIFDSGGLLTGEYRNELSALRFETIASIEAALAAAAPGAGAVETKLAAHALSGIGERLGLLWLEDPTLTKAELVAGYVDVAWRGFGEHLEKVSRAEQPPA